MKNDPLKYRWSDVEAFDRWMLRERRHLMYLTIGCMMLLIAVSVVAIVLLKKPFLALWCAFWAGVNFNSVCYQIVKYKKTKLENLDIRKSLLS